MAELPPIGKIDGAFFNEVIFPRLGAKRPEVVQGPQHGVDVGIIEIGEYALATTADPVFIVPEYGWERAAWFALHILASDAACSGLAPAYLAIDLNLPMETTEEALGLIWNVIHEEAKKIGISVITGHTARYEGCHWPMVGGAALTAIGPRDSWVGPRFMRPGDRIIVTKGPAIEAAGIFAAMFPDVLEREFGTDFARSAQELFYMMSVVQDARVAVSLGVREDGVSAMHDATECGLWGGLYEMSEAAGLGAVVEIERIPLDERAKRICSFYGIDPYSSISEGTLIITSRPHKAPEIVEMLNRSGIPAAVVGYMKEEPGLIIQERGSERHQPHPRVDPFWRAFYDALGAKNA
ncbi:MAG: AIR synthase family protein [candidate division WOR-3 bacterium]